jgi:sigma-B regulation protein RsbU (phosphoserine phosphatase)
VTYLPAGELSEVGGDFYDIFRGSGGWMLMVGDVVGQGAEAATLSSLARYTVRAAAELTGDPARAIGHLNSVLREQPGLPLCTVVCANLEELPGGDARLHLASAGHPAPLLVRGEEVTAVGRPGTIAGAFDDDGEWTATEVEMRRGDLLVLYTDGVLDAVGPDDRFGDDRLREALAEIPGAVEERVARLTERLEAFRDGERRDDLTVLMLEYRGAPELSGPQQPAAGQPRR